MTKTDLVNYVADTLEITKKDAKDVVEVTLQGIVDGILNEGKVALTGFGTFSVAKRNARTARNPQTGEPVEVAEKFVPKFKASTALKDGVAVVDYDALLVD